LHTQQDIEIGVYIAIQNLSQFKCTACVWKSAALGDSGDNSIGHVC